MILPIQANELYFAKTKPSAIIPSKNKEDMGYDFYPCFEENLFVILKGNTVLIPTGIACALHTSKGLIVKERSSIGSLGLTVHAGIVDSGYRGEIFIAMQNNTGKTVVIDKSATEKYANETEIHIPYSKAIAQGIIVNVPVMQVKEVTFEELKTIPSKRGEGALGSSGK